MTNIKDAITLRIPALWDIFANELVIWYPKLLFKYGSTNIQICIKIMEKLRSCENTSIWWGFPMFGVQVYGTCLGHPPLTRRYFISGSIFKMHHTYGRAWVLRQQGQGESLIDVCVLGTDGNTIPSVIIWAKFRYDGKRELVVLDGINNQQVYRRVLQQSLLWRVIATFQKNTVLIQDNALLQSELLGISWRTRMWKSWTGHPKNPKEHFWDQMAVHIGTAVQMRASVQQAWDTLRVARLRTSVCSMPRRKCMLFSLHMMPMPIITQPSMMSLIPSTDLQNLHNL